MEKQKFYLIFITCMIAVLIYSFSINKFPFNNQTEAADFEEAAMVNPTDNEEKEKEESKLQQIAYQQNNQTEKEPRNVNQLSPLSGKSKSQIYELRKKWVANSIFARENYQPSEEVFGGIVDGKPWIDASPCTVGNTGRQGTNGLSEESRFINNPTMLVAIEYPFQFSRYKDISWCQDRKTQMVPYSIKYDASKKEIIVTYNYLPFMAPIGSNYFYIFNGLNARDLGYKYAYIDTQKSSYKFHFSDSTNIGNSVIEFQNYIHLGGSCGVEGGCNNGSPRQTFLEFQDDFTEYKYQNRDIYIKLWKKQPASPNSPADIVERIVLKWS